MEPELEPDSDLGGGRGGFSKDSSSSSGGPQLTELDFRLFHRFHGHGVVFNPDLCDLATASALYQDTFGPQLQLAEKRCADCGMHTKKWEPTLVNPIEVYASSSPFKLASVFAGLEGEGGPPAASRASTPREPESARGSETSASGPTTGRPRRSSVDMSVDGLECDGCTMETFVTRHIPALVALSWPLSGIFQWRTFFLAELKRMCRGTMVPRTLEEIADEVDATIWNTVDIVRKVIVPNSSSTTLVAKSPDTSPVSKQCLSLPKRLLKENKIRKTRSMRTYLRKTAGERLPRTIIGHFNKRVNPFTGQTSGMFAYPLQEVLKDGHRYQLRSVSALLKKKTP